MAIKEQEPPVLCILLTEKTPIQFSPHYVDYAVLGFHFSNRLLKFLIVLSSSVIFPDAKSAQRKNPKQKLKNIHAIIVAFILTLHPKI